MLKRFATSLFGPKPARKPFEAAAGRAAEAVQDAVAKLHDAAGAGSEREKAPIAKATRRLRSAPVAPALLIATGAGVAFWYWTQWARGQAESEAAAQAGDEPPAA